MKYSEFESRLGAELRSEEISLDTNQFFDDLFVQKKKKRWNFIVWNGLDVCLLLFFAFLFQQNSRALKKNTEFLNTKPIEKNIQKNEKTKDNGKLKTQAMANEIASNVDAIEVTNLNENKITYLSKKKSAFNAKNVNKAGRFQFNKNLDTKQNNIHDIIFIKDDAANETNKPIDKTNSLISFNELHQLPNNTTSMLTKSKKHSIGFDLFENGPKVACPTFRKKRKVLYAVLIEAGFFFPLSHFVPNNLTDNQAVIYRSKNEKTLEGIHFGVFGKIDQIKKPFYIKAGLNFERITRKNSLFSERIERDTTIGIISTTQNQSGDTITIIRGPIITETKITQNEVRHYYHRLWSFPIALGYKIESEAVIFSGEIGVAINAQVNQRGNILTNNLSFENSNSLAMYKRNIGLSYLAALQIGYKIYDNHAFYGGVRARFIPQDFQLNSQEFSEKHQMLGGYLSYEFKF